MTKLTKVQKAKVRMTGIKYQFVLSALIAALDKGKFADLDIGEVQIYGQAGAISILLGDAFQSSDDVKFFSERDWTILNEDVASMANAIDSPSKSVATNKGIALLMAWILEGVKQHT